MTSLTWLVAGDGQPLHLPGSVWLHGGVWGGVQGSHRIRSHYNILAIFGEGPFYTPTIPTCLTSDVQHPTWNTQLLKWWMKICIIHSYKWMLWTLHLCTILHYLSLSSPTTRRHLALAIYCCVELKNCVHKCHHTNLSWPDNIKFFIFTKNERFKHDGDASSLICIINFSQENIPAWLWQLFSRGKSIIISYKLICPQVGL